ncbi:MAG: hypothetical protein J6S43_05710 [Lentisphaeria bacterium]|nr:hypothetical protein [Lentisphaeria bacterium]
MSFKSSFGIKHALSVLLFSAAAICGAQENIPELAGYKKTTIPDHVPVFSEDFNGEAKGWRLPSGFELRPEIGRSHTKALFRHSESKKDYNVARREVRGLVPGQVYELRFWTRAIKKQAGSACVEFYRPRDNKYMGGAYRPEIFASSIPGGWQKRHYRFTAPEAGVKTFIGFFIFHETKAVTIKEAVWDDVTVVPVTEKSAVLYLTRIKNLNLDDNGTVSVAASLFGELNNCKDDLRLLLDVDGNRKMLTADKDGIYTAQFGKLPPGQVKIRAWLLDTKQKTIEAYQDFVCHRPAADSKPVKGAVWLDETGRTIADGKPMLPIGVYTMDLTEKDLQIISDCGFNFIVPYTISLNHRPLGSTERNSYQRITAALDNCLKYGLRVAFTMLNEQKGFEGNPDANDIYRKMVENVKNHPGLFCYFTADEVGLEKLARKKLRRELIASLDPYHPVFVNDYVPERFAHQRWICDVFGYDIYPVTEDKNTSLSSSTLELARLSKMSPYPHWFVPQAWQSWLTDRQMLAHSLSGAVFGARGFVLYSYNTNSNKDEAVRNKLLPGMKKTVHQLQELAPWILSNEPAPGFTITPATIPGQKDSVNVRAFRDEKGRDAIIIVSDGPGTVNSEIQFSGSAKLVSKYGNTVNAGNGKYIYKASGINCDVLLPAE